MRCPVIELLTEIRDRLRNLDTLEIQREKARLRMRAKRATQRDVREQDFVREQKEDEKGKETFPPAPPIENKGKVEENAQPCVCAREDERAALFAQFWSAYPGPRKRCKPKCRARVFALLADPATRQATFARLMSGLDRWKHHDTWMRDGGRYIQAPLVWLNNEDWDAEIAVGRLVDPSARFDPKAAAFERQRAEAEERRRRAEELAASILERRRAELAKSEARHD